MSTNRNKFDWLLSSLTPTESQVPSTAEIIQKCLSVNPFDLKFREANLQINNGGQGNAPGDSQHLLAPAAANMPSSSVLTSVLNLPPSLASTHSPGIFSNINVLTADIEGEIRKTIDLSRKVQQLRENGLLSRQDDGQQLKTPCTSDVLNAVLDMSSSHQHLGGSGQTSPFIPSASLIAASLSSALNSSSTTSNAAQIANFAPHHSLASHHQPPLLPTNSIPNLKIEAASNEKKLGVANCSSNNFGNNFDGAAAAGGFTPVSAQGKTLSTPDLHLNSALDNMSGFKQQQHSPVLSREALAAVFQSAASTSASSPPLGISALGQQQQQQSNSVSCQSSPATSFRSDVSSVTTLANGCNLADLNTTVVHHPSIRSGASWSIAADNRNSLPPACPPQIKIAQQSPYSSKSSPESKEFSESGNNEIAQHQQQSSHHGREKHRKYAKLSGAGGSSADSQVTSTRGCRGRRSAINDMPPDERRVTILERNKAAAVRYRKRKKEEHDEMIGRVYVLEQEKNALETQNSVLRRELERLTFLLQERESRCVCKANQLQVGFSIIGGSGGGATADERSPSANSLLNGYSGHPQSQIRPGSAHSTH